MQHLPIVYDLWSYRHAVHVVRLHTPSSGDPEIRPRLLRLLLRLLDSFSEETSPVNSLFHAASGNRISNLLSDRHTSRSRIMPDEAYRAAMPNYVRQLLSGRYAELLSANTRQRVVPRLPGSHLHIPSPPSTTIDFAEHDRDLASAKPGHERSALIRPKYGIF
jgi:hypothetical protein